MLPIIWCQDCGYQDTNAARFCDHMVLTRHGLNNERYALMIETGYLWELEKAFRMTQDETAARAARETR